MAAGLGFKTFTTGEVLTAADVNGYLMQGILVFANATARDAAITSPQEGQCCYLKDTDAVLTYSGSAWVGFDDSNAIQNSIINAKGDLISGSANDTPAILSVGSNGETLVADSSTSTGLRWQGNYAAGKNKIINGDFGIWQRGTSFSPPAFDSYVADRFRTYFEGSGTTRAVTRQTFTPGTAPVAGYEGQYFLRYAQTVGPSAGIGNNLFMQNIEDVRTFAGQTVTFSFWAKAAATTVLPLVYAYQYFGTGGSPSANVQTTFASNVSVGTSWTRYSYTAAIPSISGKTIGTNNDGFISFRTQHPLGSGDTFTIDYWGWQVEIGNTATAFQTATGNLAGELAAAQRYYWRTTGQAYTPSGVGMSQTTSSSTFYVNHPVPMRVGPSTLDYSNLQVTDLYNYGIAITNLVIESGSSGTNTTRVTATHAASATQYRTAFIRNANDSAGYIGFSAEL